MTIYLDVIFLENIIMNYIIIFATSIVLKIKANYIRIFIASALGSIYSVLEYVIPFKIYYSVIAKLLLSITIIYISFNALNIKIFCRQLLIFYLTTFVFGGVATSMIYIINSNRIIIKNNMLQGNYPIKIIIFGGIIGFFIIIVAFKVVKNKITTKDILKDIKIQINNTEIKTKAMVDTGNLLKEPISNIPVIVVERTLLYDAVPKEILNNLENILGGDFSLIPENIQNEYISRLKFIPFTSLGKPNGMLVGLLAEKVYIEEIETKKINKAIIGIYDKSLTKRGEYRALLGIDLV